MSWHEGFDLLLWFPIEATELDGGKRKRRRLEVMDGVGLGRSGKGDGWSKMKGSPACSVAWGRVHEGEEALRVGSQKLGLG